MEGGSGNDVLNGDAWADGWFGGDGDDILMGSTLFSRDLTSEDHTNLRNDTPPMNEDGDTLFTDWSLTGTDVASSDSLDDTLIGGAGDDLLFIGHNDLATGGPGSDGFVIGDWFGSGNAALVTDFGSTEDVIVVLLADDNADAEITITVADLESGNGRLILIDGVTAAIIVGTFDPEDGLDVDTYTPAWPRPDILFSALRISRGAFPKMPKRLPGSRGSCHIRLASALPWRVVGPTCSQKTAASPF